MGGSIGPLVPKPGCGASRFCFTWWLLATCFLHSAHSVSHFTLPQAERSIHLVQTLLTGLGRRRPLLGRMRGGHEGHWSAQLLTDMSLAPHPLSPVPSWPCKSLWELAAALHAPPLPAFIPAPWSTWGAGLDPIPPESPPHLQTDPTLLLCRTNFGSFLFYLLTFSSQVGKNSSNFLSICTFIFIYN